MFQLFVLSNYAILSIAAAYFRPDFCSKNEKFTSKDKLSTFLWKIESQPPSYFFGTIHVPYTQVWDYVSPTVKQAMRDVNSIVLELDLSDTQTVVDLRQCQNLPTNVQLSDLIIPDIYERLKDHISYVQSMMSIWMNDPFNPLIHHKAQTLFQSLTGDWELRRPIWILLMLNSLTESHIRARSEPVLDLFLAHQAHSRGQIVGAIENATDQCGPLNALHNRQVSIALNQTLTRLEVERGLNNDINYDSNTGISPLVRNYQCGSLDESVFSQDTMQMGQDSSMDKYMHERLIVKRNIRMADRVKYMLKNNNQNSYVFAFGAGHFLGAGNIVDLIRDSGYVVSAVKTKISDIKAYERKHLHRHKSKNWMVESPSSRIESPWLRRRDLRISKLREQQKIESTKILRAKFEDLWVRMENYTQKPWHEIEFGSDFMDKSRPKSAKVVRRNNPTYSARFRMIHYSSGSNLLCCSYFCITLTLCLWFVLRNES